MTAYGIAELPLCVITVFSVAWIFHFWDPLSGSDLPTHVTPIPLPILTTVPLEAFPKLVSVMLKRSVDHRFDNVEVDIFTLTISALKPPIPIISWMKCSCPMRQLLPAGEGVVCHTRVLRATSRNHSK